MKISLIAAMAENRVIGRDNRLPWHLPDDLKRFKRLTTGHTVIMGRKTYEAIGKPLPDRRSIVVTTRPLTERASPDSVVAAGSIDEALELAGGVGGVGGEAEVFVAGGEAIYRLTLPQADRLHLTLVHAEIPGDAHFPPLDLSQWKLIEDERHEANQRHAYAFSFRTYDRVRRRSANSR